MLCKVKMRFDPMPGIWRSHYFGARGEQQAIVRLVRLGGGFEIAQTHRLGGAIDGKRFGARAHVDAIACFKQRFRRDEELLAFGNGAGDVIGQAAIGEADVRSALYEHDLRGFADATQARRRRSAAGDASDDDDLHVLRVPLFAKLNGSTLYISMF